MTNHQAKEILLLYRPGTADVNDDAFVQALASAREDSELQNWFAKNNAVQQQLRLRFKEIPVPEGLKEQIISERRAWTSRQRWQRPVTLVAVAALIALLISLAALWLQPHPRSTDKADFATFLKRSVSQLLREYAMTLETSDLEQIRAHLAETGAPADYVVPKRLQAVTTTGCGVLTWQQKPVSMLCFRSGKPLRAGDKADIFLLIADRASLPDAPSTPEPQMAKVNRLLTASWTEGERVYVLATEGDEEEIRRYLFN